MSIIMILTNSLKFALVIILRYLFHSFIQLSNHYWVDFDSNSNPNTFTDDFRNILHDNEFSDVLFAFPREVNFHKKIKFIYELTEIKNRAENLLRTVISYIADVKNFVK